MQKARENLERFRASKAAEQARIPDALPSETDVAYVPKSRAKVVPSVGGLLKKLLNIDLLETAPFRVYYDLLDAKPFPTAVATVLLFATGFYYAVQVGLGEIFAMFAALTAILLSLGKKKDCEVSASSVVNENCEGLLGQMTSDHFERDVLRS